MGHIFCVSVAGAVKSPAFVERKVFAAFLQQKFHDLLFLCRIHRRPILALRNQAVRMPGIAARPDGNFFFKNVLNARLRSEGHNAGDPLV